VKLNKVFASAASVAFLAAALAGCSSDSSQGAVAEGCTPESVFSTLTAGTLTVSVPEFPPFSSTTDGSMSGVDAEILNSFAERNCLTVTTQSTSYAGTIPAVQSDRADVAIGCYYRTAARAEIVGLSDPIYTDQMASISADGVVDISAMEALKVGTVDGYLWVPDMKTVMGDNLTIYPSAVEMKADYEAGRIQVGLDGYGSAALMYDGAADATVKAVAADSRVVASQEPAQIGFPHTKSNPELTDALNAAITAMKADGSIESILVANGLPATSGETGEPRLVQ